MEYLLDTCSLIEILEDRSGAGKIEGLLETGDRIGISFVTAVEFLTKAPAKARRRFLALIEEGVMDLHDLAGAGDAAAVAEIRNRAGLRTPDAMILRTAAARGMTLITGDTDLARRGKPFCRILTA